MVNNKIDFKLLKTLREKTLAGFDLCKEALLSNENNLQKAIEWLKVKGIAKGVKKTDTRQASEGMTKIFVSENQALMLSISCETDFVIKNKKFQTSIEDLGNQLIKQKDLTDLNSILDFKLNGETVKNKILHLSGQIGEKIVLTFGQAVTKKDNQSFAFYNHSNHKNSALLVLSKDIDLDIKETLAMQVVALNPQFIKFEDIPEKYIASEKKIVEKQLEKSWTPEKPEKLKAKILENKLNKQLKEQCLLNQKFIKDNKLTIQDLTLKYDFKILSMFNLKIGV